MKLEDIAKRPTPPAPWAGGEKIPWNEPAFSQRMLEHHLCQDHDWASRRFALIDKHVAWIEHRFAGRTARILDLACGPGFYTQRLARAGHVCAGVDFSPAAIAYARTQARNAGLSIRYDLADIRSHHIQGLYDLIMIVFGEFNVFRTTEIRPVLTDAARHLKPSGMVLVEASTLESLREDGQRPEQWSTTQHGLFSDKPYTSLEEHFWDEPTRTCTTRYSIVDSATREVAEYSSTSQAYTEGQYRELFASAGLPRVTTLDETLWPTGTPFNGKLRVMTGSF